LSVPAATSPGEAPPLVYVVDDDTSFLRAITRRLEAEHLEVRSFASAGEFLACSRPDRPSCAVIDLRMPEVDGMLLQTMIREGRQPIPLIFLTGHGDVHTSVEAMKRGAVDFLLKPVAGAELVSAVDAALGRDREARRARQEMTALQARYETLTPREREVFTYVARGLLNKQIAWELGTSERTVKAHRAQVMQKTGCECVADLVRLAEALGVVTR
jgi:FixJ family two-component response regulator